MTNILPTFFTGFAMSAALIMAIGAQNLFVLRQGLKREHVGPIVLFCGCADAILIAVGVGGVGALLGAMPQLTLALTIGGALFLAWYGFKAFQRMMACEAMALTTHGRLNLGQRVGRDGSVHLSQSPRLSGHCSADGCRRFCSCASHAFRLCGWRCGSEHQLVRGAGLRSPHPDTTLCAACRLESPRCHCWHCDADPSCIADRNDCLMTHLTMNDGMSKQCQPDSAGHGAGPYYQPTSVAAWWQWLVAISQVAVEHHYAAPWKLDAERHQRKSATVVTGA